MADESMAEESTAAAPAAPMADRSSMTSSVSFVRPADGSTVSSPVSMEFIVSNLYISPVPDEVETAREGMGHYHVAIDTECLAVGELIPKADPWVHFGDGSKIYETLMTAGQHTLTLQIGRRRSPDAGKALTMLATISISRRVGRPELHRCLRGTVIHFPILRQYPPAAATNAA